MAEKRKYQKQLDYYYRNREQIRKQQSEYKQKHLEEIRAYQRAYYLNQKDKPNGQKGGE